MIVTIKPKNGKPIKKKFSDPKQAIEWINSTTAELAAQQNAHPTLGESAPSQAVTNADVVSKSDGVPPSAPARVA